MDPIVNYMIVILYLYIYIYIYRSVNLKIAYLNICYFINMLKYVCS